MIVLITNSAGFKSLLAVEQVMIPTQKHGIDVSFERVEYASNLKGDKLSNNDGEAIEVNKCAGSGVGYLNSIEYDYIKSIPINDANKNELIQRAENMHHPEFYKTPEFELSYLNQDIVKLRIFTHPVNVIKTEYYILTSGGWVQIDKDIIV